MQVQVIIQLQFQGSRLPSVHSTFHSVTLYSGNSGCCSTLCLLSFSLPLNKFVVLCLDSHSALWSRKWSLSSNLGKLCALWLFPLFQGWQSSTIYCSYLKTLIYELYCLIIWTLGDGEGQGNLACCSPWGHKQSDTTELLNNNSVIICEDKSDPCHLWPHGLNIFCL